MKAEVLYPDSVAFQALTLPKAPADEYQLCFQTNLILESVPVSSTWNWDAVDSQLLTSLPASSSERMLPSQRLVP
nr:uncharacterized protein CTRU02_11425 [Colletotrichum truncatum]KAF6785800.1 hypothetical protein CTRU02_11425 [Colletotrichum truncatum]